ncbi:MAG: endopeptidase La [Dysgonamonadaceae bacterium]|jgi:ATP-dependent Lon protease|nr:endopeptidase La [Dysgonamonadaceae bacterium]
MENILEHQLEIVIENKPLTPDEWAEEYAILPLKNLMFLPGILTPINVGREKPQKMIRDVRKKKGIIGVFCQKDINESDPGFEDLYPVGTAARIVNIVKEEEGSITIVLMGINRIRLKSITAKDPYLKGYFEPLTDIYPVKSDKEYKEQLKSVREITIRMISEKMGLPDFIMDGISKSKDIQYLIDLAFSAVGATVEEKQNLMATDDVKERMNKLLKLLDQDVQLLNIKADIRRKTQTEIDKQQREYFLQQEMKNIQEALGGGSSHEVEINNIKEKAKKVNFTPEQRKVFDKELQKLERINTHSPEHSTQMEYVQTLLSLPWNSFTKDNFNLKRARRVLDKEHFGLEKVKERILEHLAVLKLKGDMKSPIICLHGPPGVGKTSLGKSVSESLGRKYVRMSLGGLHDESEIRGHSRTYIGSMPGRIIRSLQKAGSANPVIILDEIDKVGQDYKGDPAAALLEVLDPEQNVAFHDNYIDIDFDLSKVLFIATANTLNTISQPLLDRMELIDVSGYICEEKLEIARRHLIPHQLEAHGIAKDKFGMSKRAILAVIESYTRESGVRALNKQIAKIMRKVALAIVAGESYPNRLEPEHLRDYLGVVKFSRDRYEGNEYAGVVTGLAWTAVGGEILFIETSLSRGKGGKLTLTGNLGDVMKESAILSLEYIKSHAGQLGIPDGVFDKWNVHLHVPEGAIPKDGPSAGITMTASMVSAFTQRKTRPHIAMTGEMTLRGKVLPVGGIKEKILAAKRAGITDIVLCSENRRNIEEINEMYIEGLTFHYVDDVREVLDVALLEEKINNPLEIV